MQQPGGKEHKCRARDRYRFKRQHSRLVHSDEAPPTEVTKLTYLDSSVDAAQTAAEIVDAMSRVSERIAERMRARTDQCGESLQPDARGADAPALPRLPLPFRRSRSCHVHDCTSIEHCKPQAAFP